MPLLRTASSVTAWLAAIGLGLSEARSPLVYGYAGTQPSPGMVKRSGKAADPAA